MAQGKPQEPEDVIREALDRVTAAVLTLAMETLRAHSGNTAGGVPDATYTSVRDLYRKIFETALY